MRVQNTVALDDDSEPEPDASVVRGAPRDYRAEHPTRPALIVEVAQASLPFVRVLKPGATVSPLAAPAARIAVTDLLA